MSIDENRLNQIRPDGRKYDPATTWLHWITVGLILPLWIIGQTADWFPQPARMPIWSVHVLLGFAIALILLTRIAWRANFGRSLPPVDIGLLNSDRHAGRGEGQDFALELAEPGCGSGDQHKAGLDPCRLHRHARDLVPLR